MTSATYQPITLQDFSKRANLDESPAWELFNTQVQQKPMPTIHHSRLQKRLVAAIDQANSDYEAFPELRCVLKENSIVPDIAILSPTQIPTENQPVSGAPSGLIEILSPDQSTTKLIAKIQNCMNEGSQLGWLIDSQEQVIMVFLPHQPLQLISGDRILPVLEGLTVSLSPNQIFAWLS